MNSLDALLNPKIPVAPIMAMQDAMDARKRAAESVAKTPDHTIELLAVFQPVKCLCGHTTQTFVGLYWERLGMRSEAKMKPAHIAARAVHENPRVVPCCEKCYAVAVAAPAQESPIWNVDDLDVDFIMNSAYAPESALSVIQALSVILEVFVRGSGYNAKWRSRLADTYSVMGLPLLLLRMRREIRDASKSLPVLRKFLETVKGK